MQAVIKPECVVSSGCGDPIKNEEETNDEDMHKATDTDTSSSHENHLLPINIKEEAVKVEIKTEDDISTDDERSPEYVASSSAFDPVKSEETDNEELDEDTNTSSEQPIKEKGEINVKAEEDEVITDDGYSSEMKQLVTTRRKSSRLSNSTSQPRRYRDKRKREGEEINGTVQKTARRECSVEGCTRKAAGNGRCGAEHGGKNLCSQKGCTKYAKKGGVCLKHGAKVKTCNHKGCTNKAIQGGVCAKHGAVLKTCKHEGCKSKAQNRGVCFKHGAKKKICSHKGCINQVVNRGVCAKHGAVLKTCSYEGCTNKARGKGGVCIRHGAKVKTCNSRDDSAKA